MKDYLVDGVVEMVKDISEKAADGITQALELDSVRAHINEIGLDSWIKQYFYNIINAKWIEIEEIAAGVKL